MFVTTSGGLYRYAMHDILEVTGFHGRTPSVRFIQKRKGIVSFTGEKLTETQVLGAAREALGPRGRGRSFIAAVGRPPETGGEPSYLFLVEYDTPPTEMDGTQAARELERALARHNIEYAAKRESGRLGPLVLRVLEAGQFDAFERRAFQKGARDGQFKLLRLVNDETFADQFEGVVGDFRAD